MKFTFGGKTIGSANVINGVATLTTAALPLGNQVLKASDLGDDNFTASTSSAVSYVVSPPQTQTIMFTQPATPSYVGTVVNLVATASSGLPVSFTLVSGPATLSGSTLSLIGQGTVVVTADQAGNVTYLPAPEVTRSISVIARSSTLSLTATPNVQFAGQPVLLTATLATSGGSPTGGIAFFDGTTPIGTATLNAGSAAINANTLSVGAHTINAVYSGDNAFAPQSASATVTIVGFLLSVQNPNVNIFHGGTATFSLLVGTTGLAGLPSDVSLSVTGQPPHATAQFTPSAVPVGSGATPATLTIKTANYPDGSPFASLSRTGDSCVFAVCGLAGCMLAFGRRKRKLLQTAALGLMLSVLSALSGCGAGWGTQVFDLTITAKAGQVTKTVAATITTSCANGQKFCRW